MCGKPAAELLGRRQLVDIEGDGRVASGRDRDWSGHGIDDAAERLPGGIDARHKIGNRVALDQFGNDVPVRREDELANLIDIARDFDFGIDTGGRWFLICRLIGRAENPPDAALEKVLLLLIRIGEFG